jgi:hypothetical protein
LASTNFGATRANTKSTIFLKNGAKIQTRKKKNIRNLKKNFGRDEIRETASAQFFKRGNGALVGTTVKKICNSDVEKHGRQTQTASNV